ncbi:P-loop containing nucleoside triphosphate hydrolase protein [Trichoderma asperelloides]|nr:P-loop containing nucleoside triphosphate hydrolase protein [Trichoderma asperelloides]
MMPLMATDQQALISAESPDYKNVQATLDAYTNGGKTTAARHVFKQKFLLSEGGEPISRTDEESYGVWKKALEVTEEFGTLELGNHLRKAAGFCGVEELDDTDADSDSELNAFVRSVQNHAEAVHVSKLARETDVKRQISVYRHSIVRLSRAFHPDHEKVLAARAALARLCVVAHEQGEGTDNYLAEARKQMTILGPAAVDSKLPKVLQPAATAQETDWQTLIDGLTGHDANAYQEAASARLLDLQLGASETRANARVWLTRFKELVETNNAIQANPKVLTDTGMAWEDTIKEQRLAAATDQYKSIIGHGEAKRRIRERLERSLAGESTDKLLMLKGPSGNGKSELIKCVQKALGLEGRLYTMNLGNVKDAKPLVGWSSTYVSGAPSPITQHLLRHKTGDVMFALEEVDKASDDVQQVVATLLGKNDRFVDAYFDLSPDLSRAHFVLTYNDEELLIPHLRDRVKESVATTPLNAFLKERVLTEVLIPRKNQEFGLNELTYDNEAVRFIMQRSSEEKGARQLEADVARVASNVDWRRKRGETISVVEAHHVARAVDGAWAIILERSPSPIPSCAIFIASLGFLDAQEKLSGEGLQASFEASWRKWHLRLFRDGARLMLVEGEQVMGDFELTLPGKGWPPPRFVFDSIEHNMVKDKAFIDPGEEATWSWREDDRALQGLLDAAKASEHDENAVLECELQLFFRGWSKCYKNT